MNDKHLYATKNTIKNLLAFAAIASVSMISLAILVITAVCTIDVLKLWNTPPHIVIPVFLVAVFAGTLAFLIPCIREDYRESLNRYTNGLIND